MTRSQQLFCAYLGYVFITSFFIGWLVLAGFIPPLHPSSGAGEIAGYYRDHTMGIRFGMVLCMVTAALLLPWSAVIATQLKRIEGRHSPLVYTQIAAAALLVIEFIYPMAVWCVAAFRPEADPEIIWRLNDLGWLAILGVAATLIVQNFVIGWLILQDKREVPIFPRWFGYFNFWIGIMFIPGELIWFFKSGPFAWNGLVSFWFVVAAFSVWMVLMTYYTARAIKSQPDDEWTEVDPLAVTALISQVAALQGTVDRLTEQQPAARPAGS